jgi:exodeoxyribonuclease V gamma subunit
VLANRAQAWRRDKTALPPCSFDVALDDGTIVECNLRSPYREGLLNIAPGAMHGRHWLRPWIEYLALAACSARVAYGFDADVAAVQIALEKDGVREYALRGIDTATARTQLDALLAGYRAGQSSALPFFPKSAWAYVQTLAGVRTRDSSEEKALATARQLYDGDEHISGERDDAWVALAFRDREPLDDATDAFIDCSLCAFGLLGDVLHGGAQ